MNQFRFDASEHKDHPLFAECSALLAQEPSPFQATDGQAYSPFRFADRLFNGSTGKGIHPNYVLVSSRRNTHEVNGRTVAITREDVFDHYKQVLVDSYIRVLEH